MSKNILLLFLVGILCSCGGDPPAMETIEEEVEIVTTGNPDRAEKAQNVCYTVPSLVEVASLFKVTGNDYNPEIINPHSNVSNYSTNSKKALNFGVYGADLSYINIFENTQETILYLNCSKKLADELGISEAFDAETMERIEENVNVRDSILKIMNDAYWITDAYLKENEQDNLSALVISGGWIEGMYLGTKVMGRTNPKPEIAQRIADQKFALNNLVSLLGTYEGGEIETMAEKLTDLKLSFDKFEEVSEESVVEEGEVATIGGGTYIKYDEATIIEIADKVEKIRNEIIQ